MKTLAEIATLFPNAIVEEVEAGKLMISYPSDNWIGVPSKNTIRRECGASVVYQLDARNGRVFFLIKG